jgi:hypothetical protein
MSGAGAIPEDERKPATLEVTTASGRPIGTIRLARRTGWSASSSEGEDDRGYVRVFETRSDVAIGLPMSAGLWI